jgi:hypothetical protein
VARGKGMDGFNPQALHELFLARSKREKLQLGSVVIPNCLGSPVEQGATA